MDWTDRTATLGLLLTLSLGICTLFLVASDFVLGGLFEFLGLATVVVGWFILAPAYYFHTRTEARETESADGRDSTGRASESESADAMAILRRRYAAGELSEAEFEQKVERLLETDAGEADGSSDARVGDELDRELEYE
ncbi:SHOCT domain-containing protein [Natrinema altunense]|uniref:SHOCT domain-containing protein n=1 Tax=Natrinema altunense TaxID=222984 RepID=A0A482XYQ3_9EURY|nr:SHOCT domain-containing protein [Natrinema altunense]RZH69138.1 SHOCT domain-containing protein [Natrinema altunense]